MCIYVCQTITFESLVYEVYVCISGISPGSTGQVCIWRSSGQGQGHMSKKVENPYSRNVKLRLATTPVRWNIEPWTWHVAWDFRLWRIKSCDHNYSSCEQKWPLITKWMYLRVVGRTCRLDGIQFSFHFVSVVVPAIQCIIFNFMEWLQSVFRLCQPTHVDWKLRWVWVPVVLKAATTGTVAQNVCNLVYFFSWFTGTKCWHV